jgi:DNA repair exonuclease SbcCD ATPase subunit
MAAKSKHINSLVESMQELNNEKRTQFETLQARQEELETAIAAKEMHESRTRELQLQAQEALERAQIAEDALEELQREHAAPTENGFTTLTPANAIGSGEISKLLADAAAKSEAKLAELRDEIARLEQESIESEEQQARQLRLRSQEIERLRTTLNEKQAEFAQAINGKESSDAEISEMEHELETVTRERETLKEALRVAQVTQAQFGSGDVSAVFCPKTCC